jgi:hypothetical protein
MAKSYIDIGHADRESILWALEGGKIRSYKSGDDTHESIWGSGAMNMWRGRYDPKTDEMSIVPPVLYKGSLVPEWLMDKLEAKFGSGLKAWRFNPRKQGVRIR